MLVIIFKNDSPVKLCLVTGEACEFKCKGLKTASDDEVLINNDVNGEVEGFSALYDSWIELLDEVRGIDLRGTTGINALVWAIFMLEDRGARFCSDRTNFCSCLMNVAIVKKLEGLSSNREQASRSVWCNGKSHTENHWIRLKNYIYYFFL